MLLNFNHCYTMYGIDKYTWVCKCNERWGKSVLLHPKNNVMCCWLYCFYLQSSVSHLVRISQDSIFWLSGVAWVFGAQGKKWNWRPFSWSVPENFQNCRPKTNLGHFQKWQASASKKLYIHILYTFHNLIWTSLWSPTNSANRLIYYFFFISGWFQRPPKVAPGASAPLPP